MKQCSICMEMKPSHEIVKKTAHCQPCNKKYNREMHLKRRDAPGHQERQKKKVLQWQATEKGIQTKRRNATLYRQRHPEKLKAHNAVHQAIITGRLTRTPCAICGKEKVEAHHEDYLKPLEVVWLCRFHHREKHGFKTHTTESPLIASGA